MVIYFVLNIRLRSYDYNMHVEGLLPANLCSLTFLNIRVVLMTTTCMLKGYCLPICVHLLFLNRCLRSYDYNMHVEGLLPANLWSLTLF